MSLINQMLKDLEKRSKPAQMMDTAYSGLQPTAAPTKNRKAYLLRIAFACLIIVWLWNVSHYLVKHHFAKHSDQSLPTQLGQTKSVALPQNMASLTAITLQIQGSMTHLRLLLNQDVLYQVSSDLVQHTITIKLKNIRLMTNAPTVNYESSALSDIKVTPDGQQDITITLMLKPDARLNNLELNKEGKLPELQIDFMTKNDTVNEVQPNRNQDELFSKLKKVPVEMSIEQQYQQALSIIEEGNLNQAVDMLALIVAKYPEFYSARESLATVLVQQGNLDKADQLLSSGLQLQPFYPPFIELKARILVNKGKIQEALHLLKKAPPALNANPEYYAFIAALYQQAGQLDSAESLYKQLTTLRPEKGAWWLGLGITLESKGMNTQALEAYAKASNSADLDPEARGYIESRLQG